jgi:SAM-dependent methyltransferase
MRYDNDCFDFSEHMFEDIKKEKPRRILNIACGHELKPGQLKNLKADFYGVDVDIGVIGGSVKFCNIDKDSLPFGNSFFDVVLCIFGIEHFKKPQNLFSEVNRVLKNGGEFIIVTPNAINPVFFLNKLFCLRKFYFRSFLNRKESYKTHYRSNTISSIAKFAKRNNFGVEEIVVFGTLSTYSEDLGNFNKFARNMIEIFEKVVYTFYNNLRPRIYISLRKASSA